MNFGDFVREKRRSVGVSLQVLAEATAVDISTVSRIENNRTKATLQTAARLCIGLQVRPEELAHQVLDVPEATAPQAQEPLSRYQDTAPTEQDIVDFLVFFQHNPSSARTWLIQNLNLLLKRQSLENRQFFETDGIDVGYHIPALILEDIDKLTVTLPLYSFKLEYPASLSTQIIWEIYQQGGVLITSDADMYISQLRHSFIKQGGHHLGDVLKRLEAAAVERAKVDDVITLDKELNTRGQLLGMFLSASTFSDRLSYLITRERRLNKYPSIYAHNEDFSPLVVQDKRPSDHASMYANKEMRLAYMLVLTNRWFYYYYGLDSHWLIDMRNLIHQIEDDSSNQ